MTDHLLMALIPGPDYWEAEPVVIRQFGQGQVSFELDDGSELIFDRAELIDALEREEGGSKPTYTDVARPPDLLLGAEMQGRRRRRR